jgi:hypothetical protein
VERSLKDAKSRFVHAPASGTEAARRDYQDLARSIRFESDAILRESQKLLGTQLPAGHRSLLEESHRVAEKVLQSTLRAEQEALTAKPYGAAGPPYDRPPARRAETIQFVSNAPSRSAPAGVSHARRRQLRRHSAEQSFSHERTSSTAR